MTPSPSKALLKLSAIALVLSLPLLAKAYDFPLSPNAIRDAYFLGSRATSLGPGFLAQYTQTIPALKVGRFTSGATLETPFSQVAVHASRALAYSAQDAIKEFYDQPSLVRLHLNICYKMDAPENALRIKVFQNKREIFPESYDSSPYYPATDEYTRMPGIGENVELAFKPDKIQSSTFLIVIDTPDGQHAETTFDLVALR